MNITFFVGNGFDINLGLETKYVQFYPYFHNKAKESNMILKWMNEEDRPWADLEEKLGNALDRVNKENLHQFYDDKDEMDGLLSEYLDKEQKRYLFNNPEEIKKEFIRSMNYFMKGMSEKEIASIQETMNSYCEEDFYYTFVVFNYTDIMDRIFALFKKEERVISTHRSGNKIRNNSIGKLIHVNGITSNEMILAVNDENQINNDLLKKDEMFLDTFIKKRMNDGIGQRKVEKVKEIIQKSHIICIFGMSIGSTDKMWWEEIVTWLFANSNNKLIIFWKGYEERLNKRIPARIIRLNDKIKRDFFEKGKGKYNDEKFDLIKDRIIISYNSDIFSFPVLK